MAKIKTTLDDLNQYKSLLWGGNLAVDIEKVILSIQSEGNKWGQTRFILNYSNKIQE